MSKSHSKDDELVNRRGFLRNPFRRLIEESEEHRKTGTYRLIDLKDLPDEKLATLKPKVSPYCTVGIEDDQVMATISFPLFSIQDDKLTVFNQFNGKINIAEISQLVAQRLEMDYADAFKMVRDVFVDLVIRQVCVPSEPPESLW